MFSNFVKSIVLALLVMIAGSALAANTGKKTGTNTETTPEQSTVVKGLDVVKFRQMTDVLRAHPEYADVEFRAQSQSEDMVYHSTVKIGPFSRIRSPRSMPALRGTLPTSRAK